MRKAQEVNMGLHKGHFRIISSGHYTPEHILSNRDLEKIVDTSDAWITSRTGIRERRIANGENTSDLALHAAQKALDKAAYDKSKIDLIIAATFTPELRSPGVAARVQAKLGLDKPGLLAFDVNAACTGFIFALNIAERLLKGGSYRSALVIGAEVISKVTDYRDRNTCVLFGDGAGALILEKDSKKEVFFNVSSRSDEDLILYVDQYINMNGPRVYQFASRVIESSIRELLQFGHFDMTGVHKIIPHQANMRIIESAAKALGVPLESFFVNIQKYGNTSAASIPIALDEMLEEETPLSGEKVLLVGFGAGLSYGACALTF
ncbi:MAG: ketoacyl-ACP synthase III [Candidatus Marinimicrobia bacterium]|nr:ketoacyl-ACP synthase III [Candidatus Neomarinimicrobiota bacterium]MDD4960863.1 ketoacyl-ACP synthase III [Candidatus Neomarinimicrobiota bacterium]MDD5710350.1 ketoacyl-ACP synthase III [Candidatus Neomarinimicrobiota bacterium]